LWDTLNEYVKYIGILIYLIQISAYSYTALINPGLVKRKMVLNSKNELPIETNSKNFRICIACNVMMDLDEGTSHCEDCNVCVEGKLNSVNYYLGLDHHCPWTSKCVGKNNLKSFYVFVSFTPVLIGFLFFGMATSSD